MAIAKSSLSASPLWWRTLAWSHLGPSWQPISISWIKPHGTEKPIKSCLNLWPTKLWAIMNGYFKHLSFRINPKWLGEYLIDNGTRFYTTEIKIVMFFFLFSWKLDVLIIESIFRNKGPKIKSDFSEAELSGASLVNGSSRFLTRQCCIDSEIDISLRIRSLGNTPHILTPWSKMKR